MKNKSLYNLYLLSREHKNKILATRDVLKVFGYSQKGGIKGGCQLNYFIDRYLYQHPRTFYKIRDVVAINLALISLNYDTTIIPGPDKEPLRLIPRNEAPFYLLKEYGGTII